MAVGLVPSRLPHLSTPPPPTSLPPRVRAAPSAALADCHRRFTPSRQLRLVAGGRPHVALPTQAVATLREQMRDKTAISRFSPRANRGLDESWSDRWALTVQDGFSDAFMSYDWLSTKFAAPVLIASRSDLKHPIMFRKPP